MRPRLTIRQRKKRIRLTNCLLPQGRPHRFSSFCAIWFIPLPQLIPVCKLILGQKSHAVAVQLYYTHSTFPKHCVRQWDVPHFTESYICHCVAQR